MVFITAVLTAVGLVFATSANAQEAKTLGDARASAMQVTGPALNELLTKANVVNSNKVNGDVHRWTNEEGGSFTASTSGGVSGARGNHTARGAWSINDKDQYCVKIEWKGTADEKWCRYIFKSGDKYFGVGALDDAAPVSWYEFTR